MTEFSQGFNEGYERGFDAGYKTGSNEKIPVITIHKTTTPLMTLIDIGSICVLIGICFLIAAIF